MYERFTDRARKVMQLANQEAQRFNHEYIGTEHILLGLVKEGLGVAANVLHNLGVNLDKARLKVEKIVQSGPAMVTMGKLPQTPRAKKVIEYSIEEARNLNHNYVGTEHLLLGLLREQKGVAAQVLMNLGLTLQRVREEVVRFLGGPAAHAVEPLPGATTDEPLSVRARVVMALAGQEAQSLKSERVGTEHVLLGIVAEGTSAAARVLRDLGGDPDKVRAAVLATAPLGPFMVPVGPVPQTSQTGFALGYACHEAGHLGQELIDADHLLLGILRASSCRAAKVLGELGIDPLTVRERLLATTPTAPLRYPSPRRPRSNCAVSTWPMDLERRLFEGRWFNLRIVFGGLVGTIAGAMANGTHGATAGAAIGCMVGAVSWFTPALFLGSLAGAIFGRVFMEDDVGILVGAALGTVVAGFVVRLSQNLQRRYGKSPARATSEKA
jgi:ATP-dependent Clp protease ATP-binding subunit ClpA